MNATTRTRLKWELALIGVLVIALVNHRRLTAVIHEQLSPESPESAAQIAQIENDRQDATIPRGFAEYPYYFWETRPVAGLELNDGPKWKPGEIALRSINYWDKACPGQFERSKPGQRPLVLINDTNDTLGVPCQDGDIYIMLEVKLGGKWTRAQYHGYSGCGNSYTTRFLPPHSYVTVLGYQSTTGRLATSRFVIKNGAEDVLMTPELPGVYSPDDVAMCAFDQLSMGEASLPELKAFLLRKTVPTLLWPNQSIHMLRFSAWQCILSGRHDPGEALGIAREVLDFDPSLESKPELLEQVLLARHTGGETKREGKHRIHGFVIMEKEPSGNAK